MRIISGTHKGRKLQVPKGQETRPTSDRAREALFNMLAHGLEDFTLSDCVVIDLFAGTGALGCEALSRGAHFCLFIENNRSALGILKSNQTGLSLEGISLIKRFDATKLPNFSSMHPNPITKAPQLIFADPPYGQGLGEAAFINLADKAWLEPGAILVLEEQADADINLPETFELIKTRVIASTQFLIYRFV